MNEWKFYSAHRQLLSFKHGSGRCLQGFIQDFVFFVIVFVFILSILCHLFDFGSLLLVSDFIFGNLSSVLHVQGFVFGTLFSGLRARDPIFGNLPLGLRVQGFVFGTFTSGPCNWDPIFETLSLELCHHVWEFVFRTLCSGLGHQDLSSGLCPWNPAPGTTSSGLRVGIPLDVFYFS